MLRNSPFPRPIIPTSPTSTMSPQRSILPFRWPPLQLVEPSSICCLVYHESKESSSIDWMQENYVSQSIQVRSLLGRSFNSSPYASTPTRRTRTTSIFITSSHRSTASPKGIPFFQVSISF